MADLVLCDVLKYLIIYVEILLHCGKQLHVLVKIRVIILGFGTS